MWQVAYYVLWAVLTFWAIAHLLINKREPVSTISWILFVLAVPLLGPVLFFSFGPERLMRQATKRKREIEKSLAPEPSATPLPTSFEIAPSEADIQNPQFLLARKISDYLPTKGNDVDLLHDPDHALQTMERAIRSAKVYIHLEYYIISSDHITEQIFDSLIEASKRGVEVRILYDSLGSLSLKKIYFRKLRSAGIQIAGFLPFALFPQRFNVNFRNHRKILIIDGNIAFTGGTNIGKEYLGKLSDNQWRDFSVKLEGPVCSQMQDVFRKDWHFTTQEDLSNAKYFPQTEMKGDATIQVLESGPDSAFHSLHQALFLTITSAAKEVSLMTPYFIPDSSMMTALTVAALRGVDVKLVLPMKSDSRLVRLASQSFYDELLQAGVKIYEFEPKVLHAKLLTADNRWTIVGSGNMDIRSFRLNFEITLFIQSPKVTEQAKTLFESDLLRSRPVLSEPFALRPTGQKILENACRLLSPIL